MTQDQEKRTQLGARLLDARIAQLDELCAVNKRSRRDVLEILIENAHAALTENPAQRINPQ